MLLETSVKLHHLSVCALNSIHKAIIMLFFILGTFLLQPIEVHLCTPGPSVCQLVVEFQSVFNGVVTALVLLYDGQDSIHAFVGSLSVAGAQGNVIVDGLERGSYYVSVFALDILELTSMYYPANGPTKSSIPPPSEG